MTAEVSRRTDADATALLSVRGLRVTFATKRGRINAVRGVDFDLGRGEILGLVGESGSGKSVTAMAIVRLLAPPPRSAIEGQALLRGQDLLSLDARSLRRVRGREIALVFQDPISSLNPVLPVGFQIAEAVHTHDRAVSRREADKRAVHAMGLVGIPQAARRVDDYPHQFSGGMRQRVMIAMAVVNTPDILIADEATTALDVTIQAQIMDLFRRIRDETGTSILLITHDLGLVAEAADRIMVMYAGRIVERGVASSLLASPRHPYTKALIASRPRLQSKSTRLDSIGGEPPDPATSVVGCAFQPRCWLSQGRSKCLELLPQLLPSGDDDRLAACHYSSDLQSLDRS